MGDRFRVIDLRDGKEVWTALAAKNNGSGYVTALAFSPDGKILASGTSPSASVIRLWDVASGAEIGQLEGHSSWLCSLVFWPDGKKLASSSGDQTIRIWDVPGRKCLDVLRGHRNEVWRVALLPDGKTLVSGAKDGSVCFWDTSVTHPHQASITIASTERTGGSQFEWQFAPDGRSILTVEPEGHLVRWGGEDFQQPTQVLAAGDISSSCFSHDGRFFAVSRTNGILQVWDTTQGNLLHQMSDAPSQLYPQEILANGNELITYSYSKGDIQFQEWDLAKGREVQSWPVAPTISATALTADEQSCMTVGFRKDDFTLRNLNNGNLKQLHLGVLEADAGVFSRDGTLFAVASSMGLGRVWDTSTWKPVATLGNFLNGTHGIAFSPDDKRLAIAGHDEEAVRLCDTESWQDVATLKGPGGIAKVEFSPDGNSIAWGRPLVLWRAPSWEEVKAAEAKDPPSPSYGATGKTEDKQP